MEITIRHIGNSKGILLTKTLLAQSGLSGETVAEVEVLNGSIVLRKSAKSVRHGWAEAASLMSQSDDQAMLLGEFNNTDDDEWVW